jgi:hypothetical protein
VDDDCDITRETTMKTLTNEVVESVSMRRAGVVEAAARLLGRVAMPRDLAVLCGIQSALGVGLCQLVGPAAIYPVIGLGVWTGVVYAVVTKLCRPS